MPRAPICLLVLLAIGCEGTVAEVPDGDARDAAAPDGAVACSSAVDEPLAADCPAPEEPDVACTLEVSAWGGSHFHRFTFDAAGRETSRLEAPSEGASEHVEIHGYDEVGRVVLWQAADDGCARFRATWLFAPGLEVERYERPGELPECTEAEFVGALRVARREDEGCDCVVDWTREVCEHADGRLTRCRTFTRDGTPGEVTTWSWYPSGQLEWESDDFDGDGDVEHYEHFEYDAQGRVTSKLEVSDPCPEGSCRQRRTWEYEDAARRTTERWDEGDDGSVERVRRRTLDEQGRPVRDEESRDGDEVFEQVRAWNREVDGARTTTTHTANGEVLWVAVEEVDEAGRLRMSETTSAAGDSARLELEYDSAGQVTTERRSATVVEGEGAYECEASYAWSGAPCPVLAPPTPETPAEPVTPIPIGSFCVPFGD